MANWLYGVARIYIFSTKGTLPSFTERGLKTLTRQKVFFCVCVITRQKVYNGRICSELRLINVWASLSRFLQDGYGATAATKALNDLGRVGFLGTCSENTREKRRSTPSLSRCRGVAMWTVVWSIINRTGRGRPQPPTAECSFGPPSFPIRAPEGSGTARPI